MMVFAATMLAPLIMALWGLDAALWSFVISALATSFSAPCCGWRPGAFRRELKTRDGLMLVALTWVALPAVAGFPLWHYLPINFTEAYFEAASGLRPPPPAARCSPDSNSCRGSINLWRHLLSLAGRHGHHRAGGGDSCPCSRCRRHADYRTEMPGPMKDSKLTPRIEPDRQTAVGGVCRTDRDLHRLPEVGGDELVRRRMPMGVLRGVPRRILDLRRQHRTLQFAADRNGADGVRDLGGPGILRRTFSPGVSAG